MANSKAQVVTVGLPGSGKTTWALELAKNSYGRFLHIEKDTIRVMLKVQNGKDRQNEAEVIKKRDELIEQALINGNSVVVSDTNLNPIHIERLREIAKRYNAGFTIKSFLNVPYYECIKRDAKRPNPVGEKVISQMYHQWLAKPRVNNPNLPKAIICDLDGTVSLLNGRNPYDASKCENDLVNEPVAEVIRKFQQTHTIIYVSGREDKHHYMTINWLISHGVFDMGDLLYMRPDERSDPDSIIKSEIYEKYISSDFNVSFVLDDRDSVVWTWRVLGLTVFQVNYGSF